MTRQAAEREAAAQRPRIGPAEDGAERQADRIAQALTAPGRHCTGCAAAAEPCPACAAKRATASPPAPATAASGRLPGPGAPLPTPTRAKFEQRLGRDLGAVRLHQGTEAAAAARAVQARAFALGPDIVLGAGAPHPATPEGERLLAHEVAHTLQPNAAEVLRRQAEAPPGPDPLIGTLREQLDDDDEEDAIATMRRLSPASVAAVLGDGAMRALAVSAFNDEEMLSAIRAMNGAAVPSLRWLFAEGVDFADFRPWLAGNPPGIAEVLPSDEMRAGFVSAANDVEMADALGLLPGLLARKLDWLRAEGTGPAEARTVINGTPAADRPAIFDDTGLRDWFVEVCDDILMQNMVMLLGGRLIQRLRWMQAEGTSWTLLRVVIGQSGLPEAEKGEVLDDAGMRAFFTATLGNTEMAEAVETLGGTLSQKMEWLHAEGSDIAPAEAQRMPQITPRDATLMQSLDRATPLFQLFEAAESAREAYNLAQVTSRSEEDRTTDVAEERRAAAERMHAANAALRAELQRQGYADEAAFTDEMRRFEAFFHGFALQTAFLMLRENRELAERERRNLEGEGFDALYAELEPARRLFNARMDLGAAERDAPSAGVREGGPDMGALRERVRLAQAEVDDLHARLPGRFPILARREAWDHALGNATNPAGLRAGLITQASNTIENIDQVNRMLSEDSSRLWKMQPVISRAQSALNIVEGSAMHGIVRRKVSSPDEMLQNLVIGAFALGLGLVSGGAGTIAVLAAAGSLGLSAWQVSESLENYSFEQAAAGSALDPSRALSDVEPSAFWLALDIVGVFADLGGLATAMRSLGPAAAAMRNAANAAEAASRARALEQAAAALPAGSGMRGSLADAVHNAAEREVARRASIEGAPDLVRRIREVDPRLAGDTAAQAGLARMGGPAAEAALNAFRREPGLLQRLGRICEADAAAAAGAQRLRAAMGDDAAFAALLRDGLTRQDPRRAQSLLSMAGSGHLSDDALRRLAAAGAEANPAARAAALAEAAEREAAAAAGTPLPGSREAAAALDRTKDLNDVSKVADPAAVLRSEWEAVQAAPRTPLHEGEYVAEVTLPNGHRWRQRRGRDGRGGGWCRFSTETCFPENVTQEWSRALSLEERAVVRARGTGATRESFLRGARGDRAADWSEIRDRLRAAVDQRTGRIDLNRLPEADRRVLEDLAQRGGVDLENATLRDVGTLFERRTVTDRATGRVSELESEADILLRESREAEERAIEALRRSTQPLYDRLRAASPSASVRETVLRRAGGQDQFLRAAPPSGALDVDHIVPLSEIARMDGFARLDWKDQVEIANALENLRAVDRSANRSRQALSWGDEWAGRSIYTPEALRLAQRTEEEARAAIQRMIRQRLSRPAPR